MGLFFGPRPAHARRPEPPKTQTGASPACDIRPRSRDHRLILGRCRPPEPLFLSGPLGGGLPPPRHFPRRGGRSDRTSVISGRLRQAPGGLAIDQGRWRARFAPVVSPVDQCTCHFGAGEFLLDARVWPEGSAPGPPDCVRSGLLRLRFGLDLASSARGFGVSRTHAHKTMY